MATIQEALQVVPSQRQLLWQQKEFFAFIHFGMNTMTDTEWGTGEESPQLFNPSELDAEQWVATLAKAGVKAAILTCKHHDGFCLWPSKYTEHSVKNAPWKNGQGDVVKEFSNACHRVGIKFGVYLSPWDRHESTYGQGVAYDNYFVAQLEELLTQYGEIFEVWFDGANGEGPNGKVQLYDWQRYYDVIHQLQPNAVIAISGPDVRWVGNEAGKTRASEWSVVPSEYANPSHVADHSQQVDDSEFINQYDTMADDLGSRAVIENYQGQLIWYPAEVDVSIRPGWFYHAEQDTQVKSSTQLFDIYKKSVGGNCVLLLNIPPNKKGLISEPDVVELTQLGQKIMQYHESIIQPQVIYAGEQLVALPALSKFGLSDVYWQSHVADEQPQLTLTFAEPVAINYVTLQENIRHSQRIEKGTVIINNQVVAEFTTVGYQKLIEFPTCVTNEVTIIIEVFRGESIKLCTVVAGKID